MSKEHVAFGHKIRGIRVRLGLTQDDMAQVLGTVGFGVCKKVILDLEHGQAVRRSVYLDLVHGFEALREALAGTEIDLDDGSDFPARVREFRAKQNLRRTKILEILKHQYGVKTSNVTLAKIETGEHVRREDVIVALRAMIDRIEEKSPQGGYGGDPSKETIRSVAGSSRLSRIRARTMKVLASVSADKSEPPEAPADDGGEGVGRVAETAHDPDIDSVVQWLGRNRDFARAFNLFATVIDVKGLTPNKAERMLIG